MRFFNGTTNLSQSINKCSIYVNSYLDQLKISKGNNGFIGIPCILDLASISLMVNTKELENELLST